jgi:hypothetical protein
MKALLFASAKDLKSKSQDISELKKNLSISGIQIEEVDIDSFNGSDRATNYDLMSFPSLVAVREDGIVQNVWQGELPDYATITQAVGHI